MGDSDSVEKRDTILILPHTFFNDCFMEYKVADAQERRKCMVYSTFIAEYLMLRKAFNPHLNVAATTEVSYNEFKKKLKKETNMGTLTSSALEDAVFINKDEQVNNLGMEQSLIAIANEMYKENNITPIIVVRQEAKENWVKIHLDTFYKVHKEAIYRVEVYTMEEILIYLKSNYNELYNKTYDNLTFKDTSLSGFTKIYIK